MSDLISTFLATCPLDDLADEWHIKIARHPALPLALLNYDQLHSPAHHPLVRECRQKLIETLPPYRVVGRSFYRFYNLHEEPEETSELTEHLSATYQVKHDGSIIMLYFYAEQWRVATRGSFAMLPMATPGPTWEEAVFALLPHMPTDTSRSYILELCTQWNRVVRPYDRNILYLLAVYETAVDRELDDVALDRVAAEMGVARPETFHVNNPRHALEVIEAEAKRTYGFEGLVAKFYSASRGRYVRVKIKSAEYLALHHFTMDRQRNWKTILPLIMSGEIVELLSHPTFQNWKEEVEQKTLRWERLKHDVSSSWALYRSAATVKELALALKRDECPYQSLMFTLYRQQIDLDHDFWTKHQAWFIEHLEAEERKA